MYRQVLLRGGHPVTLVDVPGIEPIFFHTASEEQLRFISPVKKLICETFDVRIRIDSESNTRELTGVDPARQAIHAEATGPLLQTILDRSARGEMRWVVGLFPTDAAAQDAEMSLEEYEDFVYAACLLNDPDPVASWRRVRERQQVLVDWLQDKKEVRVIGPDTDLRVGIAGRTWINCFGDFNMPDGEVYTGPVETEVNGTVRFSFPAIYEGREVEDVRLWFENGVVVKWSAAKNEAFLTQMLNTDEGARRVGEFAFGHQLRHPAVHQEHAVRREDRRHDPHGDGRRLPGIRLDQPIGHPLGHGLRSAPGERDHRGRPVVRQGRQVSADGGWRVANS